MKRVLAIALLVLAMWRGAGAADVGVLERLSLDRAALAEAVPLALDAVQIMQNAMRREARHKATLAAKGIAEEPPSKAALRYTIDTCGLGEFLFDDWGELYIDRRFVTDDELERIKRIEAFIQKHVIAPYMASQGSRVKGEGERAKGQGTRG